jgi:hypothetical protein
MAIGRNFHPVPSIRGENYLIVGLIQTIGQIEFSVSTGHSSITGAAKTPRRQKHDDRKSD